MKKLIYSFLLLFVTINVFTQSERVIEKDRSKTAIQDLKIGALIVRLPSNHKKLAEMRKLVDSDKVGAKSKVRLQSLIKHTEEETRNDAEMFATVMSEKYDFSSYYLIWDYSLDSLQKGIKSGYFLSKDLIVDPNIKLEGEKYLTLRMGQTKNMKLEAFRVTDQNLKDLDKPFPNYYRTNSLQYFFNTLFFNESADFSQISRIVEIMNERFKKFYAASL